LFLFFPTNKDAFIQLFEQFRQADVYCQ
jgi:hypothetical protein